MSIVGAQAAPVELFDPTISSRHRRAESDTSTTSSADSLLGSGYYSLSERGDAMTAADDAKHYHNHHHHHHLDALGLPTYHHHSRSHSSATSASASSPTGSDSAHSGVHRRRRSRASSLAGPYATRAESWTPSSAEEQIAVLLGGGDESADESGWSVASRRSSISGAPWEFGGAPPHAFGGEPPPPTVSVQSQSQFGKAFGKLSVAGGVPLVHKPDIHLETLAHQIKTAVTTSASDRARTTFVNAWLSSSYSSYPDGNVSRQGLYASYARVCELYAVRPINSASFGKAVRSSFPNIKTRRLGVRGNSKYHYCGMRPATAVEAEVLAQLSQSDNVETSRLSVDSFAGIDMDHDDDGDMDGGRRRVRSRSSASAAGFGSPLTTSTTDSEAGHRRHPTTVSGLSIQLPDPPHEPEVVLPPPLAEFPSIEEALVLAPEIDEAVARKLWRSYTEHCQSLLEAVTSFRFDQFEYSCRTFWDQISEAERCAAENAALSNLMLRGDAAVFDECLAFLDSIILQPMPTGTFTALRQIADGMEQIVIVSLQAFSPTFVGGKIELAARFGHLIVRHLGICQLTQAVNGVVSSAASLRDMSLAWEQIDVEQIRNQCALTTNCQHDLLAQVLDEFRIYLHEPHPDPVSALITWLDITYRRIINDPERSISPRSFLVRTTFVISQVMRDLTLRSDPAFGSFQIIGLFIMEWLSFQVLRKVALHVSAVSASVEAADQQDSSYLALSPTGASAVNHQQAHAASEASASPPHQAPAHLQVPVVSFAHGGFSPRTAQAFAEAEAPGGGAQYASMSGVLSLNSGPSLETPLASQYASQIYRRPSTAGVSSGAATPHSSHPSSSRSSLNLAIDEWPDQADETVANLARATTDQLALMDVERSATTPSPYLSFSQSAPDGTSPVSPVGSSPADVPSHLEMEQS